jgi:DNA-binding SARP family transcriptional activator
MRYQVLGPLRVHDGDHEVVISAPKMEVTLAALLLRANQVVSSKQLICEAWGGGTPPARAAAGIHVYISQLRKLLARPGRGGNPIVTQAPGYLLSLQREQLDCLVFEDLVRRGRALLLAEKCEEARAVLADALALWRGPVLAGLAAGPLVSGFGTRLDEIRLECLELFIRASLVLDRHRELISMLYGLIAEYPLHEPFYGYLMQALCAAERRGDALRVYRTAWDVLDRELGLEPGPTLRELQRSVLAADSLPRLAVAG